ncbi:AAA family ATPase [Sulfobacillus thermosulfidooxidans]|uniref:AAA family ATPase n=1 Tax=Sulfobacillus thermosulfidooxidans TaxID=28034 RepID=UPI0006B6052C|nr:AAA family ATPase [Sulfobacillus thermosulfidooxidans]
MKLRHITVSNVLHYRHLHVAFDEGPSGLHILYGPNETGKTTLLHVMIDWLYGGTISEPFRDHYNSQTLLDGLIEDASGKTISWCRKKRYSRLELANTSVSEDDLKLYLGGYDKERFMLLFGLDHERLREGGESLLQSGGHAGVSLFEAGGGIQHLHNFLRYLDERANGLVDPSFRRGSAKLLNKRWKEYLDAEQEIRANSVRSDDWNQQKLSIAALEHELVQIKQQRHDLEQQREKFKRVQRVKTMLPDLHRVRDQIQELGAVIPLPDEHEQQIEQLLDMRQLIAQKIQDLEGQLQQQRDQLEVLVPESQLLTHNHAILKIGRALTQYETWRNEELPKLRQAEQQVSSDIANRLKVLVPDLSHATVDSVRIPYEAMESIKRLIARLQETTPHREIEKKRYQDLLTEQDQKRNALHHLGTVDDVRPLRKILEEIRQAGALDNQIASLRQRMESLRQTLEKKRHQQTIYDGDLEHLETLPLPLEATLNAFHNVWDTLEGELREQRRDIAHKEQTLAELVRDLERLELEGHVPVEDDLMQVRHQRNQTWSLLKRKWLLHEDITAQISDRNPGLSVEEVFETLVQEADTIADRLRKEADKSAQRTHLLFRRNQLTRQLQQDRQRLEQLQNEFATLQHKWQKQWEGTRLTVQNPAEMKEWLTTFYYPLREGLDTLANYQQELNRLLNQQATFQQRLINAAEPFQLTLADASLNEQLAQCEEFVRNMEKKAQTAETYQQDLQTIADRLVRQQTVLAGYDNQLAALYTQWAQWREKYPLIPHEPEIAAGYLQQLHEIFRASQRKSELDQEIANKEEACQRFEDETRVLAEQLGDSINELTSISSWVSSILARLDDAKNIASQRQQVSRQIHTIEEALKNLRQEQNAINEQLNTLGVLYQCPDILSLRGIIEQSRRYKNAYNHALSLETNIRQAGDGLSVAELEQEFNEVDPALDLSVEIDRLTEQIDQIAIREDAEKERLKEMQIAFQALSGDRATAADEAQGAQYLLADIDRLWTEYLRIELARRLLQRAIELYRQQNESSIIDRASQFFRRLTLNHYEDLMIDYDDNIPYLEARDHKGHKRRVGQMSDGTRDQLYLALRLAFIGQHLENGESLPIILDDILVHFDDDRTKATLEVLNEMAGRTQVIYFTHHQWVVNLAQDLHPRPAQVHDLAQLV